MFYLEDKAILRHPLLCLNSFRLGTNLPSKANPAGIYLLNVNIRNTITTCEICSKLTIKAP